MQLFRYLIDIASFLTHLADSHLLLVGQHLAFPSTSKAQKWRAILLDRRGWCRCRAEESHNIIINADTVILLCAVIEIVQNNKHNIFDPDDRLNQSVVTLRIVVRIPSV